MCGCAASADNHCFEGNRGFMWTNMYFLFSDTYLFLAFFCQQGCKKPEKAAQCLDSGTMFVPHVVGFFFSLFFFFWMVFRECGQLLDLLDLCDVTSRENCVTVAENCPFYCSVLTWFHSSCKHTLWRLHATKVWDNFYLVSCIFRI